MTLQNAIKDFQETAQQTPDVAEQTAIPGSNNGRSNNDRTRPAVVRNTPKQLKDEGLLLLRVKYAGWDVEKDDPFALIGTGTETTDDGYFPITNRDNAHGALQGIIGTGNRLLGILEGYEAKGMKELVGTAANLLNEWDDRLFARGVTMSPSSVSNEGFDPASFHLFEDSYTITTDDGDIQQYREMMVRRNPKGFLEVIVPWSALINQFNTTHTKRYDAWRKVLRMVEMPRMQDADGNVEVEAAFDICYQVQGMETNQVVMRVYRCRRSEVAVATLRELGVESAEEEPEDDQITGDASAAANPGAME